MLINPTVRILSVMECGSLLPLWRGEASFPANPQQAAANPQQAAANPPQAAANPPQAAAGKAAASRRTPQVLRMFFSLLIVLGGAPLVAAIQSSLPQLPAVQVVARVNGVALRGGELNDYLEAIIPNIGFHGRVQPAKINVYRRQALDRMILHELVYQDAIRRHIRIPRAEIDREVSLEQRRFRSPAAFKETLARKGLTIEALRALIEHNLMVAEVVRRDIIAPSRVSDQEAKAYYQKNLARFREPESVLARHIFIPPGMDAARQADEVRRQALAKNTSEEFDRLARQYSKDDYRVMGGMLGWIHQGRLEPALEKAAFALGAGQVSVVVQTPTGFHLLRVEAKRPARLIPFKEARERILAQLVAKKRERLREQLQQRVYRNAKVEILARF